MTKTEKLTVLAARLIKLDDQLMRSATVESYNDSIREIKTYLDMALQTEDMADFWPIVRKLKSELKKLEMGEIMKYQFSCDKLYKELILMVAEEIKK